MILTPETHPGHHTIGRVFKGWDSVYYYCDSYDPRIGYWMTPLFEQVDWDSKPGKRKNVSERAIGSSFHRVWIDQEDDGRVFVSCRHAMAEDIRANLKTPGWLEATIAEAVAGIEVEA